MLLLHGNGDDEINFFPLGQLFGNEASVAALRGPVAAESGFRWYAHHDVGRPVATSLALGMAYVEAWLETQDASSIWLVGFSGGAVMAAALALSTPHRFAGVALLHGTLPFDAGIPIEPQRLRDCELFFGYGELDAVIPPALTARSEAYLREESGARAEIRGYRAAHELPPAEQRDLVRWYASLT